MDLHQGAAKGESIRFSPRTGRGMADMETGTYLIRKATLQDMDGVLHLWSLMMKDHQERDPRVRLAAGALIAYRAYAGYHLNQAESFFRVVEQDGQIIAFCLLTINRNLPMFLPERYGYLSDLVVAAHKRGQGIGSRLTGEGCQWLKAHGVHSVQLQYYFDNKVGEAFWSSQGFKPYYTRMWLDVE